MPSSAPLRKRTRLFGYDYSREGIYLVTLVCADRNMLFGRVQKDVVQLNAFGEMAARAWMETPLIRPNIGLGAFVIMPNHLHGIISINSYRGARNVPRIGHFISPTQTIGAVVRGFKGVVTKRVKAAVRQAYAEATTSSTALPAPFDLVPEYGSIWQANYYDRLIQTPQAYYHLSKYIWNNPKNWAVDTLHE